MRKSMTNPMPWAGATLLAGAVLLLSSTPARGGPAPARARFSLTPHMGIVAESEYVEGPVQFSNGDVDFISIDPDTGLLVGLDVGYRFGERLSGFVALSYATADAGYVEKDNLRPDVDLDTVRIQPGLLFDVASFGSTTLAIGGALSFDFVSVDRLVWHDRLVHPDTTEVGLLGLAALDVGLTNRLSLRAQLGLEVSHPFLGDLEDNLALAEGERGADIDADTRTALLLGVDLAIWF
jgi:hypothetical protein